MGGWVNKALDFNTTVTILTTVHMLLSSKKSINVSSRVYYCIITLTMATKLTLQYTVF